MAPQSAGNYNLSINEEEREELLRILEQYLVDTHVERRRTEKPSYHDQVVHEESVVRSLTEKVRQLAR
jgi:hypothetical protein